MEDFNNIEVQEDDWETISNNFKNKKREKVRSKKQIETLTARRKQLLNDLISHNQKTEDQMKNQSTQKVLYDVLKHLSQDETTEDEEEKKCDMVQETHPLSYFKEQELTFSQIVNAIYEEKNNFAAIQLLIDNQLLTPPECSSDCNESERDIQENGLSTADIKIPSFPKIPSFRTTFPISYISTSNPSPHPRPISLISQIL